jgi:hypothetical protein
MPLFLHVVVIFWSSIVVLTPNGLDPEDIKVLIPGAIWNFCKGTGLY